MMLAWTVLATLAYAGDGIPTGVGGGTVDSFTLLDASIAKGWAAFKIVHHDTYGEDGAATIDCKYPGMSATPTSGVTLATWDLAHESAGSEFVVYAPAHTPAECSPTATNEKNLADAKAAAAAHGLDVARKPALIPLTKGGFAVGDKRLTATIEQQDHDEDMTRDATATLAVDGKVLWTASWSYGTMMANGDDLEFVGAYAEGSKVVVVVKRTTGSMRTPTESTYFLTPVLDLGA